MNIIIIIILLIVILFVLYFTFFNKSLKNTPSISYKNNYINTNNNLKIIQNLHKTTSYLVRDNFSFWDSEINKCVKCSDDIQVPWILNNNSSHDIELVVNNLSASPDCSGPQQLLTITPTLHPGQTIKSTELIDEFGRGTEPTLYIGISMVIRNMNNNSSTQDISIKRCNRVEINVIDDSRQKCGLDYDINYIS